MSDKSEKLSIDEIKQRYKKARAEPWVSYVEGRDHFSGSSFIKVGDGLTRQEDIELSGATQDDQDFIAHARQDIPKLIAYIELLESSFNS